MGRAWKGYLVGSGSHGLKKSDKKLNVSSVQNIYFYALQILAFNKNTYHSFSFLFFCVHVNIMYTFTATLPLPAPPFLWLQYMTGRVRRYIWRTAHIIYTDAIFPWLEWKVTNKRQDSFVNSVLNSVQVSSGVQWYVWYSTVDIYIQLSY